jgi:hypothetical protein
MLERPEAITTIVRKLSSAVEDLIPVPYLDGSSTGLNLGLILRHCHAMLKEENFHVLCSFLIPQGILLMSESLDAVSAATSIPEAVDVVANAPEAISNILEWGGKLVYGASYTAAFVIVFPAALIFAAVPRGNALVQGMLDGSAAAQDKAQGWIG